MVIIGAWKNPDLKPNDRFYVRAAIRDGIIYPGDLAKPIVPMLTTLDGIPGSPWHWVWNALKAMRSQAIPLIAYEHNFFWYETAIGKTVSV
jgi:hypothetical protein